MDDKFHHILQQRIAKEKPETIEDLQKILNSFIGKTPEELEFKAQTDADKALELIWQAYELPPDKGRRLAQKALKLHSDCIEAYEYIGGTYSYYHKRAPYFEKGIEIGRRIFGGEYLKRHKGHFWLATETRPFMRCLASLAECHYAMFQIEQAIDIWKEMLELNPNDNQGMRYNLLPALVEIKDFTTFKKMRKKHPEGTATLLYTDALAAFSENGATPTANRYLKYAMSSNSYVPPLLLAESPPDEYPYNYTMHSREEALIYVHSAWRSWSDWQTPGAKNWLQKAWWNRKR
ncbi:MAG: hypothetical protein IT269_08280 [Saprospiraceae bacterium]|nr:hypothetical protein [Saprospiraceae bacterium]